MIQIHLRIRNDNTGKFMHADRKTSFLAYFHIISTVDTQNRIYTDLLDKVSRISQSSQLNTSKVQMCHFDHFDNLDLPLGLQYLSNSRLSRRRMSRCIPISIWSTNVHLIPHHLLDCHYHQTDPLYYRHRYSS